MTWKEIAKDYETRAKAEKDAGGHAEVSGLPSVAVTLSDGSEYFFQDEEAQSLIDEFQTSPLNELMWFVDYILASAQSW